MHVLLLDRGLWGTVHHPAHILITAALLTGGVDHGDTYICTGLQATSGAEAEEGSSPDVCDVSRGGHQTAGSRQLE